MSVRSHEGFRFRSGRTPSRHPAWVRVSMAMASCVLEVLLAPLLLARAVFARFQSKRIDAGFGPDPLINNVHHRRSMQLAGFSAESFCIEPYFITSDFDHIFLPGGGRGAVRLAYAFASRVRCAWWIMGRHRVLYTSFNGGPLGPTFVLWRLEPLLLRIAGVRTVVLPYGGDVHVPERIPNLAFRFALDADYPTWHLRAPRARRLVPLWSRSADCVYGGCDWLDCLDHVDVVGFAHFTIDVDTWAADPPEVPERFSPSRPMRVLHAPNHRAVKGSERIVEAVESLRAEGRHVELVQIERQPNEVVRAAMAGVDVVADQLVIGWYAMFALEGMAMRRAVICHLRPDLVAVHASEGTLPEGGFPFVRADCQTIADALRALHDRPESIPEAGRQGRSFVERYHSLEAGSRLFSAIQARLGMTPLQAGDRHVTS